MLNQHNPEETVMWQRQPCTTSDLAMVIGPVLLVLILTAALFIFVIMNETPTFIP